MLLEYRDRGALNLNEDVVVATSVAPVPHKVRNVFTPERNLRIDISMSQAAFDWEQVIQQKCIVNQILMELFFRGISRIKKRSEPLHYPIMVVLNPLALQSRIEAAESEP
jgi:hypothetical protein